MVVFVSNVEELIAAVQPNAGGVVQLIQARAVPVSACDDLFLRRAHLPQRHAVAFALRHQEVAGTVFRNIPRRIELRGARSPSATACDDRAAPGRGASLKLEHAVVLVVRDKDLARGVHAHLHWLVEACGREERGAGGCARNPFAHAVRPGLCDEKITVGVEGDAVVAVQLVGGVRFPIATGDNGPCAARLPARHFGRFGMGDDDVAAAVDDDAVGCGGRHG